MFAADSGNLKHHDNGLLVYLFWAKPILRVIYGRCHMRTQSEHIESVNVHKQKSPRLCYTTAPGSALSLINVPSC